MKYNVYKGVQVPVTFKWGLKGRYITWAGGVAVGTFVLLLLGKVVFGWGIGILIGVIFLISGASYIAYKAKDGVYSKNIRKGIIQIKTRKEL